MKFSVIFAEMPTDRVDKVFEEKERMQRRFSEGNIFFPSNFLYCMCFFFQKWQMFYRLLMCGDFLLFVFLLLNSFLSSSIEL